MEKYINLPLKVDDIENMYAGDYVYLSGVLYTARDAAHERMYHALLDGETLPIDLKGITIYYLGPTPSREEQVIGSAGPTTSSRMDKYTPLLMEHGLMGMIGKGKRNEDVKDSIIKYKGIYFAAVGGAGALLSKCITSSDIIAYDDLGTEAIRRLEVVNFPVIVINDIHGNDMYETAMKEYSL